MAIREPMARRSTASGSPSAFHFTARFAVGQEPVRVADAPRPQPSAALRVLVAEDNPVNRLLATRLLQKLGHTVESATNGREAVEQVRRDARIDPMDVQMPEMDGFEATAAYPRPRGEPDGEWALDPAHADCRAHRPCAAGYREQCVAAGMDEDLTQADQARRPRPHHRSCDGQGVAGSKVDDDGDVRASAEDGQRRRSPGRAAPGVPYALTAPPSPPLCGLRRQTCASAVDSRPRAAEQRGRRPRLVCSRARLRLADSRLRALGASLFSAGLIRAPGPPSAAHPGVATARVSRPNFRACG